MDNYGNYWRVSQSAMSTDILISNAKSLSPELSLAGLGLVIIILDLIVSRKSILQTVSLLGLAIPAILSVFLWNELGNPDSETPANVFGTLAIDKFSLFFKFLILVILALVIMSSGSFLNKLNRFKGEYYALLIFSATGMMLLASTTELISIYVSLELTALPLVALAAFGRDSRSTESGIKLLILSAISSAILLYGMVLVYGLSGTTHISEIAGGLVGNVDSGIAFGSYGLMLGIIMIIAGFGFKIASVPFHMWVPDVYEGAPSPITAYLSVASKAAGFAVILRLFYVAFDNQSQDWSTVFAILAAVSMSLGNLVAINQASVKRMLAYSTIAHAGYLMVGLAAVVTQIPEGSDLVYIGPGSILFYLVAYAVTNLAAFFAIIAITSHTGSELIRDLAGMGRRSPLIALILAIALISLTGIPPTAGFMGKLFIFSAAVSSGMLWLVIIGVVNSVISAYYYLRIIRFMYMSEPSSEEKISSSTIPLTAMVIVTVGVIGLGVLPQPLFDLSSSVVSILSP